MSQIVGTLLDSAGTPITGKLRVTLSGNLIKTSTNPDSIYLPVEKDFTITNGVIDIELEETETKKVTYRFEFYKTDGEGNLIEPALLDFYAIVLNASPIQFASLVPTGMVNDVLDTGALRVAQIIASDPNLSSNIGGPFPKGNFDSNTTYKYRDMVSYLNRAYISKSLTPITGILPTNEVYWMRIPVEPNGNLILGDDTPYNNTWDGSGKAASQDAVYDKIESVVQLVNQKANVNNPIFTGVINAVGASLNADSVVINDDLTTQTITINSTATAPTVSTNDNSTNIASTAYVKNNLSNYLPISNPTSTGTLTAQTLNVTTLATVTGVNICNNGSFTVGGVNTTFYPVRFTLAQTIATPCRHRLRIFRTEKDSGGANAGTFFLSFEFAPTRNGRQQTHITNIIYNNGLGSPYDDPVGDIQDGSTTSTGTDVIVWLRGGAAYNWSCPDAAGSWTLSNGNSGGTSITDSSGTTRASRTTQTNIIKKAKARYNYTQPQLCLKSNQADSQGVPTASTWFAISFPNAGSAGTYNRPDCTFSSSNFTVPVDGLYKISLRCAAVSSGGTPPTSFLFCLGLGINWSGGVQSLTLGGIVTNTFTTSGTYVSGSDIISLTAGTTITPLFYITPNGGTGYIFYVTDSSFTIEQIDIYD